MLIVSKSFSALFAYQPWSRSNTCRVIQGIDQRNIGIFRSGISLFFITGWQRGS
jgi:hypothetical protein